MRKALISLLLSLPLLGADLEFKEAFADPAQREAALNRLVPGTRDGFFYGALTAQFAGRDEEFRRIMDAWKTASEDRQKPVSADGRDILENRDLLLRYEQDPRGSLNRLIRELDLHFDATRPDSRAQESLPDRLDPAALSADAFERIAAQGASPAPWTHSTAAGLFEELERVETFSPEQIDWFRNHLHRADHPAVVPLLGVTVQRASWQ